MEFTDEEAFQACLEYFDGDELAARVRVDKYLLRNNEGILLEKDPDDSNRRLAREFARVEKKKFKEPYSEDFIFSLFDHFRYIVPQGSVQYGCGNNEQVISLSNCFVTSSPVDSYGGILQTDQHLVQISKRRGGVGLDLSQLRPKGSSTKNSSRTSTGIVTWMRRYSHSIREVGQENRRGALMITLSVHHPDILDFITIKNDPSEVTGANISVRLTDEFLQAVENDTEYELRFPVDSNKVTKKVRALDIWKIIVHSAWLRAEPGLIFWDNICNYNAIDCYEDEGYKTCSTNPCCFWKEKDVWVVTKNGVKEIKDITSNDLIWLDKEEKWAKTSGYFNAGVAPVYKVTFSNNEKLYITKNHKLARSKFKRCGTKIEYEGFDLVELKNLKAGDGISIHNHCVQDFSWGKLGNFEEGLVMGWLTGDGCLSYHSDAESYPDTILDFWEQEHDVADKILTIFKNWNYDLYLGTQEKNNVKRIRSSVYTRKFTNKYEYNIWKFKSENSRLDFLDMASREFIVGFLSSYFSADGSVVCTRSKNYSISLASINFDRLKQIKYILSIFGIVSFIRLMREAGESFFENGGTYKTKNCYQLVITGLDSIRLFNEQIGFISDIKQNKLDNLCSIFVNRVSKNKNYRTIKSIDLIGDKEVGCIEVESYHYLTANGIISGQSELPLCENDSCRLMFQNLFSYVKHPFTHLAYFDFELFDKHAKIAQRLMDDLIDLEIEKVESIIDKIKKDPEDFSIKQVELRLWESILEKCVNGRRTGLGITAEGDMLAALGVKYGSDKSIEVVDMVHMCQKLASFESSVEMSKELGPFPVWNWSKEKNSPFLLQIQKDRPSLYEKMAFYGRRNIGNLTIAPVGSLSLQTQTTSGFEPLFMIEPYKRRKKINHSDENTIADFVDPSGDRWKEFEVIHPKLKMWMNITGETDWKKSPWYGCCAEDIDWVQRVKMQAAAQNHIDHAISSCLSEDSLIQTDKGLFKIKELANDCPERCFQDLKIKIKSFNKDGNLVEITKIYNNGLSPILKICTVGDYSIECTPNHKLLTINNKYELVWKEASKFQVNDIIIMKKGTKLFGRSNKSITSLLSYSFEYDKKTNSKNIVIPHDMNPELAELIGYLCSDGSVGVNGISLSQQYNNVVERFEFIVKKLFDITTNRQDDDRSLDLLQVTANSRELSSFFKWIGLRDHDNLELPKLIRLSNSNCIRSFIRGLTLDGYISKDNLCVMTSVCYNFLKEVQILLFNLNIKSNIQQSNEVGSRMFPSGKEHLTKDSWSLIISDSRDAALFLETIGFAETRKNIEAISKFKRTSKIKLMGEVPDFGLRMKFKKEFLPLIKSNSLYDKMYSLTCHDKQGRDLSRETILEMCDFGMKVPSVLIDESYVFVKINDINILSNKQTYDLSVPDGNSYIANGFIVHNTLNLPENVTEEKVDEIYRTAWKSGCKGITVYRKNCRTGVLVEKDSIVKTNAHKRPKDLPAQVFFPSIKGQIYCVAVGMYGRDPYELFAFKLDKPHKVLENVVIRRIKSGHYQIVEDGVIFADNISEKCDHLEEEICRLVSTSLRHGACIQFVVEQLNKAKGDIYTIGHVLGRVLKKFIPDGMSTIEVCPECNCELKYMEGCKSCSSCGWSKCS